MADFYQTGVLATLHRLGGRALQSLENDLCEFTKVQSIALVLPALYPEFEGPAMPQILQEVSRVPYLKQVVVTLSGADAQQFDGARRRVAGVHPTVRVIWNDGPRIQKIYRDLEAAGLSVGSDGKGRSCWLAYGYVLAGGRSKIIALHDCDIVNYSREMLARLCYPVADIRIDFAFSKGYYARVSDRMYGRATRLLLTPLVRSLERVVGFHPFLVYLDSFRYPLAGEMCMYADMARINRIPGDWGLEIGMLSEVYRNFALKRLCQVDIADNYEHKHQSLADDPQQGLLRMTVDITKTLFRTLAAEGVLLSEGLFRALQAQYIRTAEDTIVNYHADAVLNGLAFDRHTEEEAVHAFAHGLRLAAESYLADPLGAPLIPNWNRVVAAVPDIFARLGEAVDADNA
jgi:glucosyl-3-phosphoglycerate synthase